MNVSEMTAEYARQLRDSDEGMAWHLGRGLTEHTIAKRQLGWITAPLHTSHNRDVGSPIVPYVTSTGRVIELRRRSLTGKPKYLRIAHDFPLEIRQHLYNAADALPSPRRRTVHICEGEYDAMILSQCGYRAVGVPGVTNWRPAWNHLLASAHARIVFDGDDAGRNAAGQLGATLSNAGVSCEVIRLPEGSDITDLYLAGGKGALDSLLGSSDQR